MSNEYTIKLGDSAVLLKQIESNSIDLVATDPPYGISFMGKDWDKTLPPPEIWKECFRILKPGATALIMTGSRLDCLSRLCIMLEDIGFETSHNALIWANRKGYPKGLDISQGIDKKLGCKRKVIGTRKLTGTAKIKGMQGCATAGKGIKKEATYGIREELEVTAPSSKEAIQYDGWFSHAKIKPAFEFILRVRKPIDGEGEVDNILKWGVGGVNIKRCKLPIEDEDIGKPNIQEDGRMPANIISTGGAMNEGNKYFDIDKWALQNNITEDGWVEVAESGILHFPKPSTSEKNIGIDEGVNDHPTCKPVRLFSFLCALFCPVGGTVVDPFMGSGTTGVGAIQTGNNFIGFELSPEYYAIAQKRLDFEQNLKYNNTMKKQLTLCDFEEEIEP